MWWWILTQSFQWRCKKQQSSHRPEVAAGSSRCQCLVESKMQIQNVSLRLDAVSHFFVFGVEVSLEMAMSYLIHEFSCETSDRKIQGTKIKLQLETPNTGDFHLSIVSHPKEDIRSRGFVTCQFLSQVSWLVGGLDHFLFVHILGIVFPQVTKSIIFQRGGEKPPTSMTSMTTLRIPIAKFIASDHEKPTVAGDPIHTGRSWSRLRWEERWKEWWKQWRLQGLDRLSRYGSKQLTPESQ